VRMPRETFPVVLGLVGAEVVEQQKGIVQLRVSEADRAVQVNAGTFNDRATLDDLTDAPVLVHRFLLQSSPARLVVATQDAIVTPAIMSARCQLRTGVSSATQRG
jgi:hypothetical protein